MNTDERYSTIRLYLFSGPFTPDPPTAKAQRLRSGRGCAAPMCRERSDRHNADGSSGNRSRRARPWILRPSAPWRAPAPRATDNSIPKRARLASRFSRGMVLWVGPWRSPHKEDKGAAASLSRKGTNQRCHTIRRQRQICPCMPRPMCAAQRNGRISTSRPPSPRCRQSWRRKLAACVGLNR